MTVEKNDFNYSTYGKFKINLNLRLKVETALAPDARKGFSFVIVKLKRYPS